VRRFDIYEDPERDTIEAVKHGFSWPAFFFTWVWAFAKGLPLHGAVLLGAWGVDLVGSRLFDGTRLEELVGAVPVAAALWAGAFGNDWRRTRLLQSGAEKIGSIEAPSPKQAIRDHESADVLLASAAAWDRPPLP
jgi:hypothetical protein